MEVNTLVTHKQQSHLGIGCVSKVLKKNFKVNFGLEEIKTCKLEQLVIVDTSHCKTISIQQFHLQTIGGNPKEDRVIIGNELKHFVGIGWVTEKIIDSNDLEKYPRLI